jgi:hypothetical protein
MCSNIFYVATLCNPVKYMKCADCELGVIFNIFNLPQGAVLPGLQRFVAGATIDDVRCNLDSW